MNQIRVRFYSAILVCCLGGSADAQDTLPFSYSIETFQHEDDPDVRAFVVNLEQPFLADEFEKSNFLRLKSLNDQAFLIYPRETKFRQKNAQFYGRLRGDGKALLQLSYETVSENPDGSRKVNARQAQIEVPIPTEAQGSETIYTAWASKQNQHFANLLEYYPGESFFEYLLLQSKERYGVDPPAMSRLMPNHEQSEEGLYKLFSSGLELQQSLQRKSLRAPTQQGDLTIHISQVAEPKIKSQPYEQLLEQKAEDGVMPLTHPVAALIPQDQYLLQFNSWTAANAARKSFQDWVEPLMRMLREDARNHHLWEKYEGQLLLHFAELEPLFDDGTISSLAVTGSDFFVAEGTDLTVLLQTGGGEAVAAKMQEWADSAAADRADMEDREFNYRGLKIRARYTADRKISSFVVQHENWSIVSNSHVGIRRIIDTIQNNLTPLAEATDYQYATTLLPPSDQNSDGYFYCSDAFMRYLFSPEFKVGERRRKQSLNNLVMLNNASLFHRLEYGRSPENLTDLIEGRFISQNRIVCPQGGVYSFHAGHDTATSSVFNRIKYLTPIRELKVLRISDQERSEYERYQKRLASFWQKYFTPVALRLSADSATRIDYCLLPFSDSGDWDYFRDLLREDSQQLELSQVAESVFASVNLLAGRERIGGVLKTLPGVDGVLADDPTLTDLNWLGDRMSMQFCDAHTVLEVDPTRLKQLSFPFPLGVPEQIGIATALFSAAAPVYFSVDIEDTGKAERFLQRLSSRVFLHQQNLGEIGSAIDAYQLPAHKEHPIYVVSYRVYAARIRFYVSVVGDQLVAATEPYVLHQVIDAAQEQQPARKVSGQLAFRLNAAAMNKLKDDIRIYWEEKARRASHRNIMPIYTLIHLYGASVDDVDQISDAKYGVTYFCPDGEYQYDPERDRVYSTAYGNREEAWQKVADPATSSFEATFSQLQDVLFSIDMNDESIRGHLEIRTQ